MKKIKLIAKGLLYSYRAVFALVSIIAIIALSYILGGRAFLSGAWGTDMGSALTMASWVEKYFPNVPFWYPLAGSGISFTHSYPILSFYLVSLVKRITDLTLIESFSWVAYFSVVSMALGIYAFVAIRLKNQTAALIASILFLISPIAWTWLTDWGFYAEAVSHTFVAPAIIFWDIYYRGYLEDKFSKKVGISFTLAAVFTALAFLTHYGAGFGLVGLYLFYPLGFLLRRKGRKVFSKSVITILSLLFLTVGLIACIVFPFRQYNQAAMVSGLEKSRSFEQIKEASLDMGEFFSLKKGIVRDPVNGIYFSAYRHISFPFVVFLFLILGIITSFTNPLLLSFSFFCIFAVISMNARFWYGALMYVPYPLDSILTWRWAFIPLRIILPVLAAMGITNIFNFVFFFIKGKLTYLKYILVSVFSIGLFLLGVTYFRSYPASESAPVNYGAMGIDLRDVWRRGKYSWIDTKGNEQFVGQDFCGLEINCKYLENTSCLEELESRGDLAFCRSPIKKYFNATGIRQWCIDLEKSGEAIPKICGPSTISENEVSGFWKSCEGKGGVGNPCGLKYPSLGQQIGNWVKPLIKEPKASEWYLSMFDKIEKEDPTARYDFPPALSGIAMSAPYYNVDKNLSQLYLYTVTGSSLIQRYVSQQIGSFFTDDLFYANSAEPIKNLTKWFGLKYLFYAASTKTNYLEEAGWSSWERHNSDEDKFLTGVLKYNGKNSLAEVSNKPRILVIGKSAKQAYEQVFQGSVYGIIPFDTAYLIKGGEAIDTYTLSKLQVYDAVILHGYSYKNKTKVDLLLREYVEKGGNLFIETGWQYENPDWETEKSLLVIPFENLSWKASDPNQPLLLEDKNSGDETEKFGPLVYDGGYWGISTSSKENLKNWAQIVLSNGGSPLLVKGNIGKGKVVWSGMNIFSHFKQGTNIYPDEVKVLNKVFYWLINKGEVKSNPVAFKRNNPDELEFSIDANFSKGTSLLWKEAYYPDFKAHLVHTDGSRENLSVDRSGPSLTLINLPEIKSGEKIVYAYERPLINILWVAISILSSLTVLIIFLDVCFRGEKSTLHKLLNYLEKRFNISNFSLNVKSWWKKEDE